MAIDYNKLYEQYKRGEPAGDNVQLYYLAQIPDLTRAEFVALSEEIESIAIADEAVRTGKASLSDLSSVSPAINQEAARRPFKPQRTDNNEPVRFEDEIQSMLYQIGSHRAQTTGDSSPAIKAMINLVAQKTGMVYGEVLRKGIATYESTSAEVAKGFSASIPSAITEGLGESAKALDLSSDDSKDISEIDFSLDRPQAVVEPAEPIKVTANDIAGAPESELEGIQKPPAEPASRPIGMLDWIQRGADALGVIDQTGVTDMANATVSFARAAFSKDRGEEREHLINAGVSMVSAIPIVGDAAKVWKYNRIAKQSAAAGGGVNAAGQAIAANGQVVPPAVAGGGMGGGGVPPVTPVAPAGGMEPDGDDPALGMVGNNGGGFFGNNVSQLFGGNATQGGSGYFANGRGFFGGGTGANSPGASAASQVANRAMFAVNNGVQGIAAGAASAGLAIPGLQPFAAALDVSVRALEAFNAGIEAVDRTNQAIIEGNRDLGQLNGGLAGSFVQYDARTFQRDIQRSKEMESVLPDLMEKQADFADAQQDLYGPYAQAGVVIQTQVTSAATSLVKIVDWLEPFSEMIQTWVNRNSPPAIPFGPRNAFEKGINDFIFGPMNIPLQNAQAPVQQRPGAVGGMGPAKPIL